MSLRSLLGSPPRRPPVPRSNVGSIGNDFEEGDIPATSRNFQSFLRGAKDLQFAGCAKDEVLQWLKNFVQAGRVCGVNQGEVVRALPNFVTKQARVFFLDQLETNELDEVVWDWPAWRAWFVAKFNPESKILRKMAEYRRCAQGRRSVDEYHEEFLELRSFCASKGDDLSQKVQFLSGLNPELAVLVKQSLASFPKASLDQTVELARNLSELVPGRFAGVRVVHDDDPPFSPCLPDSDLECYNCFEFGHDARDCTNPRLECRPVRDGDLDEDGDKQSPAPSPAQSPRRTFVNSIRCFGIRAFSGQQESVPDSLKAVLNDGDESSEHSNGRVCWCTLQKKSP